MDFNYDEDQLALADAIKSLITTDGANRWAGFADRSGCSTLAGRTGLGRSFSADPAATEPGVRTFRSATLRSGGKAAPPSRLASFSRSAAFSIRFMVAVYPPGSRQIIPMISTVSSPP